MAKVWRTVSGDASPRTGLVLSGGGARGAYEVGVVAGIIEVLGLTDADQAPFSIFCGSSVGAVNSAFFASMGHRGDLGIDRLKDVWRSLDIGTHLSVAPKNLWKPPKDPTPGSREYGPRLLDPVPLSLHIRDAIEWDRIGRNIDASTVHALVVTALDVADGVTTMFAHTAPNVPFEPSRDPRRRAVDGPVGPDEILASAAIPFLFPGRKVGARHFVDGSLRFNTPIAPALRSGADRLVVVNLITQHPPSSSDLHAESPYPDAVFLAGKMLTALLLDPVGYDLQVLERFNKLLATLDEVLTPQERLRIDDVMRKVRGVAYRHVDSLVVRPSADIGRIAGEHVRRLRESGAFSWAFSMLLERIDKGEEDWEADWASFLLFDGDFAEALIDMGRRDLHARADEVRMFFG